MNLSKAVGGREAFRGRELSAERRKKAEERAGAFLLALARLQELDRAQKKLLLAPHAIIWQLERDSMKLWLLVSSTMHTKWDSILEGVKEKKKGTISTSKICNAPQRDAPSEIMTQLRQKIIHRPRWGAVSRRALFVLFFFFLFFLSQQHNITQLR